MFLILLFLLDDWYKIGQFFNLFILIHGEYLSVWSAFVLYICTTVFIRLLIYGEYCSQVELAISILDNICKTREDVKLKLEVCIHILSCACYASVWMNAQGNKMPFENKLNSCLVMLKQQMKESNSL